MVTLALPLPVTPAPAVTLRMPLDTLSVVVSAVLSMSATETAAIGRMASSATLCAAGTVLTGASFTGLTGICDRVGVGGGPVAGHDRERVPAVEVEVAGIGEARQRRIDLRCRAGDGYAGAAVAADAGAGGHIEDAVSNRQRGGERG